MPAREHKWAVGEARRSQGKGVMREGLGATKPSSSLSDRVCVLLEGFQLGRELVTLGSRLMSVLQATARTG